MINHYKLFSALKANGLSEERAFAVAHQVTFPTVKGRINSVLTATVNPSKRGPKGPRSDFALLTNQCIQVLTAHSRTRKTPMRPEQVFDKLDKQGRAVKLHSVMSTLYFLARAGRCKKVDGTAGFYI